MRMVVSLTVCKLFSLDLKMTERGLVVHICNHNYLGGWNRKTEFKDNVAIYWDPAFKKKKG